MISWIVASVLAGSTDPDRNELKQMRSCFAFVVQQARALPAKKPILETLLSLPRVSHCRVSVVKGESGLVPLTQKTVIQTQELAIEDGLDHMGRVARIDLGGFSAFFYKSTTSYHKSWVKQHRAGKSSESLWKTFPRPTAKDPCVGFSVSFDAMMEWFSGRESAALVKAAYGQPARQTGRPGSTTDDIGDYWAEWDFSDRWISLSQGETSALLLRVIFKP